MKKLNNVSLNFNLREPKGKKQTQLYAVVRADGKQYKIPLQCKIEPWLWDERKQQPVLTSGNENILRIINIVSRLKVGFLEKVCYGCSKNIISELKQEINEMANPQNLRSSVTRTPKATTLLKRAFDLYYAEKPAKESTIIETRKLLTSYAEYCKAIGKDKMSMLSQRGLNEYRDYLVKQRNEREKQGCKVRSSNLRINAKCELIARLINFMGTHTTFDRYSLQFVKYKQLHEFKAKGEQKMRRPLTHDEIQAIKGCTGLTARETEYRDLFVMQCSCGCRTSDLWRLFDKTQQEYYTKDGQEAFVINTKKESIKAVIILTPLIRGMQEKYKHGWRVCISSYNKALKRIFCKAGLNQIEHYMDAHGVAHHDKLCDIIASHFGRYTFIKDCFQKGLTASEIKDLTGHASEAMINEVYLIITGKDKAKYVFKALERVNDKPQNNDAANEQQQPQQSTALTDYVLHCRDILSWLGEPRENYADIRDPRGLARLIATRYEVPLANMGWDVEAIERLYKDDDTEGYKRLKADIKRLRLNL